MRPVRTMLFALILALAPVFTWSGEPPLIPLHKVPPNTWVKLLEEPTGARNRPLFFFDPHLRKFIASGGEAAKDAHADTEHFDLAVMKWSNAFPAGADNTIERGPIKSAGLDWRRNEVPLKTGKDGVPRILRSINPYEWDPGFYQQWAYNPDDGRCFAYLLDAPLMFDPKASRWSRRKAAPIGKTHTSFTSYGAMAYDPVNQEFLWVGGTSDEPGGTPGTWTYHPGRDEWTRRGPAPELTKAGGEVHKLRVQVAALVNACRNRFYATESPAEERRNLVAELRAAAKQAKTLVVKNGGSYLSSAAEKLAGIADEIAASKAIDGPMLARAQAVVHTLETVEHSFDLEPCGRAAAAMATCEVNDDGNAKIVLFGGCTFDGYLADTWVYDCRTRTWEQRHPTTAPAPRAGHLLAWLPKGKKILLYGATPFSSPYGVPHGNTPPLRDLWTYDVATNEWKLLVTASKDEPTHFSAAVDDNDVLVVAARHPKNDQGRVTWAMQIDPTKLPPPRKFSGVAPNGVGPGAIAHVFQTPADYDYDAKPDVESVRRFLKDIPVNGWTLMPMTARKPNAHPWGACPYDTLRHQFISFGGGHSSAHFNDVAHYSLRTATWSVGYREEFPYAHASFSAFFNQTFHNRPTVPTHVWDGTAFDESTGKAVYCMRSGTWTYDPATREWEYPPVWKNGGGSQINMKGTPRGPVYWDAQGWLQLYDVRAREWSPLPIKGARPPAAYSDTGGICYDSKRDCLWLGHGGAMVRYDMKTGETTTIEVPGKPEFVSMRATAYIPELDMVLSAGRQPGDGGANLAFDIENKKWLTLPMPCSDKKPRTTDKAYSLINLSLAYDPELKLAVLHSNEQEILVARFDRGLLKTMEPTLEKAKR